jgi:predicted amidohydrolase YtcJ
MAIEDGKIVALGPEREILNKYAADKYIDLAKAKVYPVFPNDKNPEDTYCKLVNGVYDGFEMSAKDALLECTSFAARDFGIDSSGTIEVGKTANFFISDSDLSIEQTNCSFRLNEVYISGKLKN